MTFYEAAAICGSRDAAAAITAVNVTRRMRAAADEAAAPIIAAVEAAGCEIPPPTPKWGPDFPCKCGERQTEAREKLLARIEAAWVAIYPTRPLRATVPKEGGRSPVPFFQSASGRGQFKAGSLVLIDEVIETRIGTSAPGPDDRHGHAYEYKLRVVRECDLPADFPTSLIAEWDVLRADHDAECEYSAAWYADKAAQAAYEKQVHDAQVKAMREYVDAHATVWGRWWQSRQEALAAAEADERQFGYEAAKTMTEWDNKHPQPVLG